MFGNFHKITNVMGLVGKSIRFYQENIFWVYPASDSRHYHYCNSKPLRNQRSITAILKIAIILKNTFDL